MPAPRKLRSDFADLPITNPSVPLILVTPTDIVFGCTVVEKIMIRQMYNEALGHRLIAAWPGQHSTHVFAVPAIKLSELPNL